MYLLTNLLILALLQLSNAALSPECVDALKNEELGSWIASVDAWGKPVGVLRGTFTSLGDYYACHALEKDGYQYGVVKSLLILSDSEGNSTRLPSQLGICLKRGCLNKEDLQSLMLRVGTPENEEDRVTKMLDQVLSNSLAPIRKPGGFIKFVVTEVRPSGKIEWTCGPVILLGLTGVIFLIVLKATYDDWKSRHEELEEQEEYEDYFDEDDDKTLPSPVVCERSCPSDESIMSCFSLYNTLPSLLQARQRPHLELSVFNIIRTLSILWIVYCHGVLQQISEVQVDLLDYIEWAQNWSFLPIDNGFLSVDSFFYMSMFLVGYMLFQSQRRCEMFCYTKYVSLRFLRTTPTYMYVLLMWYLVVPFMGQGPLWHERQVYNASVCAKYWWTNLFYINNFVPAKLRDSCMRWSWYLAADFQLYILAPIFVLPLGIRKLRRYVPLIFTVGFALSAAIVIAMSIIYKIPALASPDRHRPFTETIDIIDHWQQYFYGKPYPRFTLMIIAIAAAYLMTEARRKYQLTGIRPRSIWLWIMRVIGVAILMAIIYLPYQVAHTWEPWPMAANVSYNLFSRIFWAIGLTLFIWPSVVYPDSSPLVRSFFEWGGWALAARLTYCVYLVHFVVQSVTFGGGTMRAQPFTIVGSAMIFGGTVMWSYLVAAILYVTIEAPTGALVKLFTRRGLASA